MVAKLIALLGTLVFMVTGHCPEYTMLTFGGPYATDHTETTQVVVDAFYEEGYENIVLTRNGENSYRCRGTEYVDAGYYTYTLTFEATEDDIFIEKETFETYVDGEIVEVLERPWYGGHPADAWIEVEGAA